MIYPSQYYIYLRTQLKESKKDLQETEDEVNEETVPTFYVNGNMAANIKNKYAKEMFSTTLTIDLKLVSTA